MATYKMVVVLPKYLNMTAGKAASQACHAAAELAVQIADEDRKAWEAYNLAPVKVVLGAKSQRELFQVAADAAGSGFRVVAFMDSGPTTQGTGNKITAVAFFGLQKKVDRVTKGLKFY